jgi:hypothetical protein
MSMSGPPGGPHPGQPQDPWQGGQPPGPHGRQPYEPPPYQQQPYEPQPYGQPGYHQPQYPGGPPPEYGAGQYGPEYGAAQYGAGEYGQPGYGQPGYNQAGYNQAGYGPSEYGQQPAYGDGGWQAPAAAPAKKSRTGLIVGLVVVLAAVLCAGGIGGYLVLGKAGEGRNTGAGAGAGATPTPGPPSAEPTPSAAPVDDVVAAQVGDCLVNDGTNDLPKLRKVSCAKGSLEVIKRFAATTDKNKCEGVPGYTHNFFYDVPGDADDFVLCFRERK